MQIIYLGLLIQHFTLILSYRWTESALSLLSFLPAVHTPLLRPSSLHTLYSHRPAHFHLTDKAKFLGLTDKNTNSESSAVHGTYYLTQHSPS